MTVPTIPLEVIEETPRQFENRQTVVNQWTVSYGPWNATSRPVVHASDATSIQTHGPSRQVIETELDVQADAQALADLMLARYKNPLLGMDLVVRLTEGTLALDPPGVVAVWNNVVEYLGGPDVRFKVGPVDDVNNPVEFTREQQQLTWTPAGWLVEMSLLEARPGSEESS